MSRASFVSGGDPYGTSDFSIHPARSSSFRPRAAGVPCTKPQTSANAGYAEAPRGSAKAPASLAKAPLLMTAMPFRIPHLGYIGKIFAFFGHMTKYGCFPRFFVLAVVVFGDKTDHFCTYGCHRDAMSFSCTHRRRSLARSRPHRTYGSPNPSKLPYRPQAGKIVVPNEIRQV